MGEWHVRLARLLVLPAGIRIRLLHAIASEGKMTDCENGVCDIHHPRAHRRFFYSFWSCRGRWTWGIGFDREGVGLYLGPWSAWIIWTGR
jgi:hypothetical protein